MFGYVRLTAVRSPDAVISKHSVDGTNQVQIIDYIYLLTYLLTHYMEQSLS